MVDFLKIPILRDHNDIKTKFRWGGGGSTLYLLEHINDFMLKNLRLWQKETNTYANRDAERIKCLHVLLITYLMD